MTQNERILADALLTLLNVEGSAKRGAVKGLDVTYHFNKARGALQTIARSHGTDDIMDFWEEIDRTRYSRLLVSR